MFARRVFGGPYDAFRITLEYGSPSYQAPSTHAVRLPKAVATLNLAFSSDDSVETVVNWFTEKQSALILDQHLEERIRLELNYDEHRVSTELKLEAAYPTLRCLTFARAVGSNTVSTEVMSTLLKLCDLTGVIKVKAAEGFGNFWSTCVPNVGQAWASVRNLNLSNCGLTNLPPTIGELSSLRILRLSHNKLPSLPQEIGALTALEVLAADHNQLQSIPVELRKCGCLRELNLEGNRITTLVLDLRPLASSLQSLQLHSNPLEYLPELSHCTALRSLSLANVRIVADATYTRWEVEVGPLSYMSRAHKLAPLFRLTFRRSSLQHPLLAGALGRIAEDRASCDLIAKEEIAIQQLVLMALSDNQVVVRQACKTIGHLATSSKDAVGKLVANDVLSAVTTLIKSFNQESQLCGLRLLSALAAASDSVSANLLHPLHITRLHQLIRIGDPAVRQAALLCLSTCCFCPENKAAVRAADGLLATIVALAKGGDTHSVNTLKECRDPPAPPIQDPGAVAAVAAATAAARSGLTQQQELAKAAGAVAESMRGEAFSMLGEPGKEASEEVQTRLCALRVLAVLGENEQVRSALRLPRIEGRGVRVLALDGGGMKGIVMVTVLRALEMRVGRPLYELFDLVVGTSTGAIVAVSLGTLHMSLDQVEAIYTKLGRVVFNQAGGTPSEAADAPAPALSAPTPAASPAAPTSSSSAAAGWGDSLWRFYKNSSQTARMMYYGTKHDPAAYEVLLQDIGDLTQYGCLSSTFIDAAPLPSPKVAVVATLSSTYPAIPYLFTSYELPPDAAAAAKHIAAPPMSSRHPVWKAVRASSAAALLLDEFKIGEERFQDGAAMANNPAMLAVQQARLLWPHLPLECVVSVGTGVAPATSRERAATLLQETATVILDGACNVDRPHEGLATLIPLIPGARYFRLQPVDERYQVELDTTDPAVLGNMAAAADEYCAAHAALLDDVAEALMATSTPVVSEGEEENDTQGAAGKAGAADGGPHGVRAAGMQTSDDGRGLMSPKARRTILRLGRRRGVLVLEAARTRTPVPDSLRLPELSAACVSALPQVVRRVDLHAAASSVLQTSVGSSTASQLRGPVTSAVGRPNNQHDHLHHSQSTSPAHIQVGPWGAKGSAGDGQGAPQGAAMASLKLPPSTPLFASSHPTKTLPVSHADQTGRPTKIRSSGAHAAATPITPASAAVASTPGLPVTSSSPLAPLGAHAGVAPGAPKSAAVPIKEGGRDKEVTQSPSASSFLDYFLPSRWTSAAAAVPASPGGAATTSPKDNSVAPQSQSPPKPVQSPGSSPTHAPGTPAGASLGLAAGATQAMRPPSTSSPGADAATAGAASSPGLGVFTLLSSAKLSAGPSSQPAAAVSAPGKQPAAASPTTTQYGGTHYFRSRSSIEATDTDAPPANAKAPVSEGGWALKEIPGQATSVAAGLAAGAAANSPQARGFVAISHPGADPVPPTDPQFGRHSAGPTLECQGPGSMDPVPGAAISPSATPLLMSPHTASVETSLSQLPTGECPPLALGASSGPSSSHNLQRLSLGPQEGFAGVTAAPPAAVATTPKSVDPPGLRPHVLIEALLHDLDATVGVVHLALHPAPVAHQAAGQGGQAAGSGDKGNGSNKLVVRWEHEMKAVVDPGPEAEALVRAMGGNPEGGASLSSMIQNDAAFEVDGVLYSVLSRQSIVTPDGTQVSTLLLQTARPAATFGAADVMAAMDHWSAMTITSAQPLGEELIEAFQRCGVRAVISPPHDLPGHVVPMVPHVLAAAMHRALAGLTLSASLQAAADECGLSAQGIVPLIMW